VPKSKLVIDETLANGSINRRKNNLWYKLVTLESPKPRNGLTSWNGSAKKLVGVKGQILGGVPTLSSAKLWFVEI